MHAASSMRANVNGAATPKAGSGEGAGTASSAASAAIVAVPPGAQRLIGTVGRLTNPDRFSRWVLRRLSRLPDVAEFTRG
jgi:hypothetical protein